MPTYPLTLADFWSTLRLLSCELDLPAAVEQSRTAAGEVLTADLGARLWTAAVYLAPVSIREGEALRATFNQLRQAGASFMAHPFPTMGPDADRKGTAIAGSSPTIFSTYAGQIALAGLPSGYTLHRGDFLSFDYGSNPVRRAFHQVAANVTAGGAGNIGLFDVVPPIRSGATAGAAVVLYKPRLKMVLADVDMGQIRGTQRVGISFSAIQTLR